MNHIKPKVFFAAIFTVAVIVLYLLITYIYFSVENTSLSFLLDIMFFICQVVFLGITISYLLLIINKNKVLTKPLLYLIIVLTALVLITIYFLALNDIWYFYIISGVLIYTGLLTSGSIVFLISEVKSINKSS